MSTEGASAKLPGASKRFCKPSWSNPTKIKSTDDLFNKSSRGYVDIAAERERRRQEKLAKKQKEQTKDEPSDVRAGKRMRVSDDSDDDDLSSSSDGSSTRAKKKVETDTNRLTHVSNSKATPPKPVNLEGPPKSFIKDVDGINRLKPKPQPDSLIKRYEHNVAEEPEIQVIGEKIGGIQGRPGMQEVQKKPEMLDIEDEEDEFPASDDEYAELTRKAREKARRKRLEAQISFETLDTPSTTGDPASQQRSQSIPQSTSPPPPPLPDPIIQILITSQIENTDPLIVSRKVSQRLKDVRLAWCHRQGFSEEFVPSVFLTWRGRRLFDVTTCKSLGIGVDEYGNILLKGQKDITGEEDRQIHMEAMTAEILDQHKKTHRRAILDEAPPDEDTSLEEEAKVKESQVKIICKAKGIEDFKVVVRPVRLPQISFPFTG